MVITPDPRMVHFDRTACCALRVGFQKNSDVVEFLATYISPAVVALQKVILTNTLYLGCVPNLKAAEVFSSVAEAEKARLSKELAANPAYRPDCGSCTTEQHMKALETVIEQLNTKGRS